MYHQAEWTGRPLVGGLCLWNVSVLEPEYRDVTVFVFVPVPVPLAVVGTRAPVGTRTARNLILFYHVSSLFVP